MDLFDLCATISLDAESYLKGLQRVSLTTDSFAARLRSSLDSLGKSGSGSIRQTAAALQTLSDRSAATGKGMEAAFSTIASSVRPAQQTLAQMGTQFRSLGSSLRASAGDAVQGTAALAQTLRQTQGAMEPLTQNLRTGAEQAGALASALPPVVASLLTGTAASAGAAQALQALHSVIPPLQAAAAGFQSFWTGLTNGLRSETAGLMTYLTGIPGQTGALWNGIVAQSAASAASLERILQGLESGALRHFSGIQAAVNAGMAGSNRAAQSGLGTMANLFTQRLGQIQSTAGSIFSAVQAAVSGKMAGAQSAVTEAIAAIRGAFNFSWSLPYLALPHVSISGGFSLSPPSVPHFSVSWYQKAMNDPMVLSNPTIFGMDHGTLLGAGEAGPEVVGGADTLMGMIRQAANPEDREILSLLRQISASLNQLGTPVELRLDGSRVASAVFEPLRRYAKARGTPITEA